jgi:hypothetical protein
MMTDSSLVSASKQQSKYTTNNRMDCLYKAISIVETVNNSNEQLMVESAKNKQKCSAFKSFNKEMSMNDDSKSGINKKPSLLQRRNMNNLNLHQNGNLVSLI